MAKERRYLVTWEIDIYAASPKDAAKKALKIHRNPESIATVFNVVNSKGRTTQIDLDEVEA